MKRTGRQVAGAGSYQYPGWKAWQERRALPQLLMIFTVSPCSLYLLVCSGPSVLPECMANRYLLSVQRFLDEQDQSAVFPRLAGVIRRTAAWLLGKLTLTGSEPFTIIFRLKMMVNKQDVVCVLGLPSSNYFFAPG